MTDDDEISEEDRKISDEVQMSELYFTTICHIFSGQLKLSCTIVQKTGAHRRFRELSEDTSYLQQLFETLVRYVKTNLGVEVFDRLRAIYPLEKSH